MSALGYYLLAKTLDALYWGGELVGAEHLPERGPAVFAANHLGPRGPIGAACTIPRRMNPWVIADMVDPDLAAEYLRWDFVEPRLRLKPPHSLKFARALSRITVGMLRGLGGVPVYKGNPTALQDTLQASLQVLLRNEYLLICPEEPDLPADPLTGMNPFMKSFARLGEMLHEANGGLLPFYPVAVHGSHRVQVGPAVVFDPRNPLPYERMRIKDAVEKRVKNMYLQLDAAAASARLFVPQDRHTYLG